MSMNNEIAQRFFEGMRQNMKDIVLPELSANSSIGQAVSIYVLLKVMRGYASPDFVRIMSESNEDLESVFDEIDKLLCGSRHPKSSDKNEVCSEIRRQIELGPSSGDLATRNQEMNRVLCNVMKVIREGGKMENELGNNIMEKIRWGLRKQLDREMFLLMKSG